MAEPIFIEVAQAPEAEDLVTALAVRGLTGGATRRRRGGWEVEVAYEHEETQRLFLELRVALEAWLEDRKLPSLVVRVCDRSYTLRSSSAVLAQDRVPV